MKTCEDFAEGCLERINEDRIKREQREERDRQGQKESEERGRQRQNDWGGRDKKMDEERSLISENLRRKLRSELECFSAKITVISQEIVLSNAPYVENHDTARNSVQEIKVNQELLLIVLVIMNHPHQICTRKQPTKMAIGLVLYWIFKLFSQRISSTKFRT
ncbi:hypothetical protein NPIL_687051 [Nephila pilipes]|uniref:Uncharacterized protein n=1 Tax=Nephila pilipes TaxID=299642 RepID=A0A8X6PMW9_NEPPI|nr:hypothetical protein NPIL_687051 [Nephila pilipes]